MVGITRKVLQALTGKECPIVESRLDRCSDTKETNKIRAADSPHIGGSKLRVLFVWPRRLAEACLVK
jgi:hypothetical protein